MGLGLLLLLAMPASSQIVDVSDCVNIGNNNARLACLDALIGDSRDESTASPAPQPASVSNQSDADEIRNFGRQSPRESRAKRDEIVSTITELQQIRPNRWIVTLENGHIWRQMEDKRYQLRVGQDVRVYSTRWGSAYRMSGEGLGSYIQVERIDQDSQ